MTRRRLAAAVVGAALLAVPSTSRGAGGCEGVHLTEGPRPLPAPWQDALDTLAERTSDPGQPWSCRGARLTLVLDGDGGGQVLVSEREGPPVRRHVASPAELVPTVEALLGGPRLTVAAAPSPEPHARLEPQTTVPPVDAARRDEPRFVAEAALGGRYTAPLRALWATGDVRAVVPFGAWSAGVWGRYGLPYLLDPMRVRDFSMTNAQAGLSLGRRLVRAPIELQAALDPSIAVISMEGNDENQHAEGAKADPRIALSLRAVLPWARTWRAVIALDAELSPAGIGHQRRIDPVLPPLPQYGFGASFGAGAAVR